MNLYRTENKARLAVALFVLALLLTIGLSLTLYSQARRDLARQRLTQIKLEAAFLASQLPSRSQAISAAVLTDLLRRQELKALAALYSPDGKLMATASTLEPADGRQPFTPERRVTAKPQRPEPSSPLEVQVRTEGEFAVAEVAGPDGTFLVIAEQHRGESSGVIFYVFSYQIIAMILGLGLVFLLVRWLLKPYNRMVEAARGSPVRVSSGMSESEFVVDTFQALIEQLHANERELANLHLREKERAEKSERFSERLISNIPSGLVTVNSRGLVTSANVQGLKIFGSGESDSDNGASDGELRTMEMDSSDFFQRAPRMMGLVSECLASGASFRREEVEVVLPDGRVRHLGLSISPIADSSHGIEGALCLMTDLTEVIELRERMKLQENLANLGEMAAGLAHEFKNSLATIHGYVQLLDAQSDAAINPATRLSAQAAINEVNLLARLVTDFLNFARPQKLSVTDVNLRSLVEECADEIRPNLSERGIRLSIEGEFATVPADDSMLRRTIVNLLRNAAEAIDLQSPEKRIDVKGSIDSGSGRRYAHLRICDTGSGISSPDLHNIFIPFFTTKSRGYGIGLAIVQKILVAHGGNVQVERSDSSGTVFHCRLPLTTEPDGVEAE